MATVIQSPIEFISQIITKELLASLYEEAGKFFRKSVFNPAMVSWLMMYQRIGGNKSLSNVVNAYKSGIGGPLMTWGLESCPISSSTSGLSQARKRIPLSVIVGIGDAIEGAIFETHRQQAWKGYRVFNLDGTDFRVREQGDLKKHFPACRDKERKSPWSIIRSCIAIDLVTGIAVRPESGAMHGENAVGEVALAKIILERLPHKSVIVLDRGLGTFAMAYTAIAAGHHVVYRLTNVRAVQANLGNKRLLPDQEISWKVAKGTRAAHPEIPKDATISGRLISHTLKKRGFKPIELFLFTTLDLSLAEIVELYGLRWNIETDFRAIKSTIEMELLDVKSADMAHKEIILGLAGYNMICHLRAHAAKKAKFNPRDISFSQYCSTVLAVGTALTVAKDKKEIERLLSLLTDNMHQIKLPKRKRPSQPRKVLRQPHPFPYLRKSRKEERKLLGS